MSFVRLSAAALVALATAACSGNPETGTGPRENTGTLVGAVAGGLIGSQFGGGAGERVAAGLAGAAVGGLLGNRIGSAMDDDDKRRAYAAQMQALESGKSGTAVAWKNPDSAAMDRWFPVPPTRPTGSSAGNTPTRSISTASRRLRKATRAAIRTAPGPRWADGRRPRLNDAHLESGRDPSPPAGALSLPARAGTLSC